MAREYKEIDGKKVPTGFDRVDFRAPSELMDEIEAIALEAGSPIRGKSGKPELTWLLLELIKEGLKSYNPSVKSSEKKNLLEALKNPDEELIETMAAFLRDPRFQEVFNNPNPPAWREKQIKKAAAPETEKRFKFDLDRLNEIRGIPLTAKQLADEILIPAKTSPDGTPTQTTLVSVLSKHHKAIKEGNPKRWEAGNWIHEVLELFEPDLKNSENRAPMWKVK